MHRIALHADRLPFRAALRSAYKYSRLHCAAGMAAGYVVI